MVRRFFFLHCVAASAEFWWAGMTSPDDFSVSFAKKCL
jgi:hypothetical protein